VISITREKKRRERLRYLLHMARMSGRYASVAPMVTAFADLPAQLGFLTTYHFIHLNRNEERKWEETTVSTELRSPDCRS
jgi:hypothetical protein